MSVNQLTTGLARSLYILAMYTGIRAVTNRVRSCFLPALRTSVINGTTIQFDERSRIQVRVHARPLLHTCDGTRIGGMISVYLKAPRLPRSLYSLMRLSSHYGCGHIELAFYEDNRRVCVFAVRNMLRANLHRIGCDTRFRNMPLWTERDEIVVITQIFDALREHNFDAYLATPNECVQLAVSPWLLNPKTRKESITALTQRYQRITSRLERVDSETVRD